MITENDIKYAERLRGLRLNKGLKQETAFSLLGLNNQQEYSKLENGKINFTDELIANISKTFNITPTEFINPAQHTSILNSPHSLNHSQNNVINDSDFVGQLIKSKDETIATLKELVEQLKSIIEGLKK